MKKLVFCLSLALLLAGAVRVSAQSVDGILQQSSPSNVAMQSPAGAITSPVSIGAQGSQVSAIQEYLIAKGYLKIAAPTGFFGPMTSQAISAFQAANNLPQVGEIGPKTLALLNQVLGGTPQQSLSPEHPNQGEGNQQNLPPGCTSASGYSPMTGQPCNGGNNGNGIGGLPPGCTSTSGYSPETGQPCSGSQVTTLPPGCTSAAGYSPITGLPCSGTTTTSSLCLNGDTIASNCTSLPVILPPGCITNTGYSSTTGQSCGPQQLQPNTYSVVTNPSSDPSSNTSTSATLTGQLVGNWTISGTWPNAWFYFGTTPNPSNESGTPWLYGSNISSQGMFSSSSNVPTPAFLTDLLSNTTYYYQACSQALSNLQPICGSVDSFNTQ